MALSDAASGAPANDSQPVEIGVITLRTQAEASKDHRATKIAGRHDTLLRELFVRERNVAKSENFLSEAEDVTDEASFGEFRAEYRQSREQICDALWARDHALGSHEGHEGGDGGDEADGRRPSDPNNSAAHPHKRRSLPPPERMVTRGVSAKKLAFSPETPTGPTAPTPDGSASAAASTTPGPSQAPQTRRRSSIATRPLATTVVRPPATSGANKVPRFKAREPKPDVRRRTAPKKPVIVLPETNSELGGYRWYEWHLRVQANPIGALLPSASKTLTTKDWQAARHEAQQIALLNRVELLKEKRLWSFRQLKPHEPPRRHKTNWDSLLDEMKWMRIDFRQERRWKIAQAYTIAHWVMEWHASSDKSSLCLKRSHSHMTKSPTSIDPQAASEDHPAEQSEDLTTPKKELDHSEAEATTKDEAATADGAEKDLPSMFMDVGTSFYIVDDGNPNHILDIPTYQPPWPNEFYLDENQHKRIVPVSHLITERRVFEDVPREEDAAREPVTPTVSHNESQITPLFGGQPKETDKTIKPPDSKEPIKSTRPSLEWTKAEENDLLYLATTYDHNWTMVSDMLYARQMGIARWRRTEWECYLHYEKIAPNRPPNSAVPDPTLGGPRSASSSRAPGDGPDPRIAQHFVTMESIRKLSRNKDRYKAPADRKPPAKIVLTTHETHYQAQTTAGIDPIGPPLTPAELATLRRTRALAAQEHGRQLYGSHQRGGVLLGRTPPTGLPVQLPYNQFRGMVRPPTGSVLQVPAIPSGVPMTNGSSVLPQHSAIRPPATPIMPGQLPQQPMSPSVARLNGAATPITQEQYMRAAMIARQQMLQQQQNSAASPQRTGLSPQAGQLASSLQQMGEVTAQSSPSPVSMGLQNTAAPTINQRLQMVRQLQFQQQQQQAQQAQQQQHVPQSLQQQQQQQQQAQLLQQQQQKQLQLQQVAQQMQQQQGQQQIPQQLSVMPSPLQQPQMMGPGSSGSSGLVQQQPQSSPQQIPQQMQQLMQPQSSQQQQIPQQRSQVFADAPHTAAAFVALQNAQQVAKMGQMTPEMIQQQRQMQQVRQQQQQQQQQQQAVSMALNPGIASSPQMPLATTPRVPPVSAAPIAGASQQPQQPTPQPGGQKHQQQGPGTDASQPPA